MERSSAVRYTYRDILSLPESETRRHEILDGKLYVTAAPRVNHQRVVFDLAALMNAIAGERNAGEVMGSVTVHVDDDMVFVPDLVFVSRDRVSIVDPEGDVHGMPDLVVEVLSPSTRSYDRELKRKHYLAAGLAELWLVDVDARSVEVWRTGPVGADHVEDALVWRVDGGAFELRLADIFRRVA